jgi:membrane-associated phospholipid phosphatase
LTQAVGPLEAQALMTTRDAIFDEVVDWSGEWKWGKNWAPRSEAMEWDRSDDVLVFDKPETMGQSAQHIRHLLNLTGLLTAIRISAAGYSMTVKSDGGAIITSIERPSHASFLAELDQVQSWATRREERAAEILSQIGPQSVFWASVCQLQPHRTPRTLELMDCALTFAMMVCMRIKHAFNCPRPGEYSPNIQPIIPVPGFSTFPSGHATESRMFADVMLELTNRTGTPLDTQLHRLSLRITENRMVAGLHFPMDGVAGQKLGAELASWFVAQAQDSGHTLHWVWTGAQAEMKDLGFV